VYFGTESVISFAVLREIFLKESLQKFKAQAEQVDKDGMIKVQVDPKLLETAKNILKKYGTR
jgi:hypothetical protein